MASIKWCFKCHGPVEMNVFVCPKCGGESFLHQEPTDAPVGEVSLSSTGEVKTNLNREKIAELATGKVKPSKTDNSSKSYATSENDILIDSLEQFKNEIIKSQNKTTHAIRALVRFLFIQLSATTLAYVLFSISNAFVNPQECAINGNNCSPNGFFLFLAVAVWIAGIAFSSQAGWDELNSSKV